MSYKEIGGHLDATGLKFGIVVSRFNSLLTMKLLEGAVDCLKRHKAAEDDIAVAFVPGSFEIPPAADRMVKSEKFDVVQRSHDVFAEYGNVGTQFSYMTKEGFGWMNASFQVGLDLLPDTYREYLERLIPPEWLFNDRLNHHGKHE